ncbi:MAG: hypothetical protein KDK90_14585 [Leptospiraceae bacterium]|nr:hypothetical protein [Leptospiraceae bacterium]
MLNYLKLFLLLFCFSNCASLQFSKHNEFWDWLIGEPGIDKAMKKNNKITGIIGNRHPFYLWLRTPEIILNPQGGLYFPDRIVKYKNKFYSTNALTEMKDQKLKKILLDKRDMIFITMDAGLVEFILPYRFILGGYMNKAATSCVLSPLILTIGLPPRLIIYPIHDVIKTVMIPVAAVYYTVKAFDDNAEEEPEK